MAVDVIRTIASWEFRIFGIRHLFDLDLRFPIQQFAFMIYVSLSEPCGSVALNRVLARRPQKLDILQALRRLCRMHAGMDAGVRVDDLSPSP